MKCPVCSEVQLVMADRSGIEIDYCPQCRGVWLDRGELDKIIDRVAATPQAEAPRQPPPVAPAPMPQHPPQQYPQQQYPPQQQPSGGILKDALGALRRGDDDDHKYRDRDYRDRDYRDNDYDHRKKKKRGGLLGDIFDFD